MVGEPGTEERGGPVLTFVEGEDACRFCDVIVKKDRYIAELQQRIALMDSRVATAELELQIERGQTASAQKKLDSLRESMDETPPEIANVPSRSMEPPEEILGAVQNVLPGMVEAVKKVRKHTPMQDWITGATIYAEAIERAGGMDEAMAKRIIDWSRDTKLLRIPFEQLGASELGRRWCIFMQDDDPFLSNRRSFSYFAANVNNYSTPLRRRTEQNLKFPKGVARRLPGIVEFSGSVEKGKTLMDKAERDQ